MDKQQVVDDAVDSGYLVEVCAGCGKPVRRLKGLLECAGCPPGTGFEWHPLLNTADSAGLKKINGLLFEYLTLDLRDISSGGPGVSYAYRKKELKDKIYISMGLKE